MNLLLNKMLVAIDAVAKILSYRNMGKVVSHAINAAEDIFHIISQLNIQSITHIGINIGPGNLISLRASIAYVCGLACMQQNIKIILLNSFEIIAHSSNQPMNDIIILHKNKYYQNINSQITQIQIHDQSNVFTINDITPNGLLQACENQLESGKTFKAMEIIQPLYFDQLYFKPAS